MTGKKIKRHRNMPVGTVFEVPMGITGFAYVCCIDGVWHWLYDFISDRPIFDLEKFAPDRWLFPFTLMKDAPADLRLVSQLSLTREQQKIPPRWVRVSDAQVRLDDLPTPYRAYSDEEGNWYITEEETKHMFKDRDADPDEFAAFIEPFLPQMKRIHVPDSEQETGTPPSMTLPEVKPEDEPVTIEIRATPECEVHRDEVEEELDEALQNAEVGDMIGAGGGELGNWDLAVECREADFKKVLKIVRRVLKKLKMPADTELVEQRVDQEDVKHLLG